MREGRRKAQRTSGRILELLRRGPMTVDELARALDLTRTAVRAQLITLLRDDLVEQRGSRRGASKPSHVYGTTARAELLFSRAYVPLLTQLLHTLAGPLRPEEFDSVLHEVGRGMLAGRGMPKGALRERVLEASALLNDLGGLTEVEQENGGYTIRSHGCPLGAATADHPEVCNALESLLSEYIGAAVMKCCDRYQRINCCFQVPGTPDSAAILH
jgi:DeoR family transcriptional regulator, suf operon transcriptional repressor